MNWSHIAQGINDAFSFVLILRLLALRLHGVYRFFCLFLLVQLVSSGVVLIERELRTHDYRLTWMLLEIVVWALSLATVYALLRAVLRTLPGILTFSHKLLNATFLVAIGIALWSAKAEFGVSKAAAFARPLAHTVAVMVVLNRAICSAALIALLAILCFVLWFPVQMPKNLAVFCVGFVVYYSVTAASWLAWSFWSSATLRWADMITMVVLSICYAYWAIFITSEGERVPVRMGHSWHVAEQQRLMLQLEAMNASLLRAARR
jgi:hypothetical protein